ncbi:hypothetical protein OT109_16885 [Phycisphaeraceae bacterium D3-23]
MPTPTPPPHPDDQLPAPLRWATRLFSSWWVLASLAVLVMGYIAAALVPVGGRYLWQTQWIDATQVGVLRWTPFQVALLLWVCVMLWTTLRRVAWRWRNIGVFIFVVGVAITTLGQSTSWRFQTRGLIAVQTIGDEAAAFQTRYLDPAQRVLFVQVGNEQPQQVPIDGLPLWHDSGLGELSIPLHQQPGLRSQLNYRAQVHAVAYIADGTLTPDRSRIDIEPDTVVPMLTPTPTPAVDRDWPLRDCPDRALVALRFTANSAAGPAGETFVWLPFDLAAGQRVLPPQTYDIAGLGQVRLAYTLASKDLGFAIAAEPDTAASAVTMRVVDTHPVTRQIIPAITRSPRRRSGDGLPTRRSATDAARDRPSARAMGGRYSAALGGDPQHHRQAAHSRRRRNRTRRTAAHAHPQRPPRQTEHRCHRLTHHVCSPCRVATSRASSARSTSATLTPSPKRSSANDSSVHSSTARASPDSSSRPRPTSGPTTAPPTPSADAAPHATTPCGSAAERATSTSPTGCTTA